MTSTSSEPTFPPPEFDDQGGRQRHGRFVGEVMGGGATTELPDDELVGGVRGAVGVLAVVALIGVLGVFSIWWLVFAVGLIFAIFMHELGHFMTARWTGMKATQFFIGFGPRVWSFRRGETEYGVRALPLGAFVRIIGMNNMEEVDPADEQRTYRVKSFPKRLLVISAGSIMHMLIAIVLLFVVYVADGEQVQRDGAEVARGTIERPSVSGAALAAGVQPGDVVLSIDGAVIAAPADLGEAIRSHAPDDVVSVTVLRDGLPVDLTATLGSSLADVGEIVAIDGIPFGDTDELLSLANTLDDGDVVGVEVQRGETTDVVPGRLVVDGDQVSVVGTTLLGVSTGSYFETIEHSVPAAAVNAVIDIGPTSWEMTKGVIKVLNPVNIFTHVAGTNDDLATRPTTLVGVTSISDDVGEQQGLIGILFLLAVLNVFVGVFNMFPLLPLDGGHAAVATYERLRERNGVRYYADVAKLMPFAMAVVTVLGFLFLSGLYLDITSPI
ncbi:MAG TPA: site-2 protease family protein [Ilumatobacter sp.]|nr:site-2 protease family protein [Ilumatobacter sp.]